MIDPRSRVIVILLVCNAALESSACCRRDTAGGAAQWTKGDPNRGRDAIRRYGCDSCHTIPGVATARGVAGPPLTAIAVRSYLAGEVANTPANMQSWIRHPREIEPRTVMPDTGVTEADGRDIAAYLFTLR